MGAQRNQTRVILREVGRIVGVLGSIGTVAACVALASSWLRMTQPPGSPSFVVLTILLALAGLGGLAAWRRNALWVLICFGVSFLPVGFYLLLTPGLGRWVGMLQLSQLLSAILLMLGRPKA